MGLIYFPWGKFELLGEFLIWCWAFLLLLGMFSHTHKVFHCWLAVLIIVGMHINDYPGCIQSVGFNSPHCYVAVSLNWIIMELCLDYEHRTHWNWSIFHQLMALWTENQMTHISMGLMDWWGIMESLKYNEETWNREQVTTNLDIYMHVFTSDILIGVGEREN